MRPKMCTWEGQTRPGGTGRDCAFQHSGVCWQAHSFGQAGQAATKWTNSPQNRQTPELNLLRLSARWSQVLPSCIDSSLEGRAGHDVADQQSTRQCWRVDCWSRQQQQATGLQRLVWRPTVSAPTLYASLPPSSPALSQQLVMLPKQ